MTTSANVKNPRKMNDKDPVSGETRNLYEDMKKPPDRAQRSKYVSAPKQAH
jgi:hypothetical protein